MKRTSLRALLAIAGLLAGFVAITGWALESSGVAVIETRMLDGGVRSTHIWYVEPDGELWVEAGTPRNGWYLDVQQTPELHFEADGRSVRCTARPIADPGAHERLRSLLREKYGFRDAWVGIFVDT
ncbi:MAG: nitroreductase/quinone reductase family protein, partial [Planctomycetota bacterium]